MPLGVASGGPHLTSRFSPGPGRAAKRPWHGRFPRQGRLAAEPESYVTFVCHFPRARMVVPSGWNNMAGALVCLAHERAASAEGFDGFHYEGPRGRAVHSHPAQLFERLEVQRDF